MVKLTSRTCCSTVRSSRAALPPTKVRYCIISFVVSVLPAPLSPLTRMDWLRDSFTIALINSANPNEINKFYRNSALQFNHAVTPTCTMHQLLRKHVDSTPLIGHPYIAPSCTRCTGEAAS